LISLDRLRALCLALPDVFERRSHGDFVPPYVGVSGWFGIYLDRRPNWQEVADRPEGSYRLVVGPL
jgi:hypothetical protein